MEEIKNDSNLIHNNKKENSDIIVKTVYEICSI